MIRSTSTLRMRALSRWSSSFRAVSVDLTETSKPIPTRPAAFSLYCDSRKAAAKLFLHLLAD
jgi:hypothetical protein